MTWNDFQEFLENRFSFSLVAVAVLTQILPSDRNGDTTEGNGDHQEVDADSTEFPVCSVHGQDQFLTVDETQNELDDQFLIEVVLEESLGAFDVAGWLNETIEGCANLREIHGSDFQEREDERSDEVESSWVEGEVAFQGVLEGFMLHLATFPVRELVATIVVFLRG